MLPNCLAPLIVQAALGVSNAILEAAALGFLGLGAQPPTPEWGAMLADSREFIRSNPWIVTLPGLAILVTVISINLVGDGLRDALDPEAEEELTVSLLEIRNLSVSFTTRMAARSGPSTASTSRVDQNEVVAIVGESGSGKSVAMLAVMGLLALDRDGHRRPHALRRPRPAHDLDRASGASIIGRDIAMIFQEPMTSLNPCFTVGFQIGEALKAHLKLDRAARKRVRSSCWRRSASPIPSGALSAFPHQLSGGMSQRVMIAMAIACRPKLLIADEPTTALDVTIQAQILDLLLRLRQETGMGLVLITHDMGVVAETAHRVVVQYAGQQVETARHARLFADPHHPYTAALLAALAGAGDGARAALDPRRRARPVRPAGGLPVLAALRASRPICAAPCRPPRPPRSLARALCHYALVQGQPTNRERSSA